MNPSAGVFLDGVASHLVSFAAAKAVLPSDAYIRFTLADGTSTLARGLVVAGPAGTYGWGLIEGLIGGAADALAIREDHVVAVEFQLEPMLPKAIGWSTESPVREPKL